MGQGLATLGALLGLFFFSACGDDGTPPVVDSGVTVDAGCTAPEMLCSGACIDVSASHDNCGSCGTACAAGEVCSAGACEVSCPGGQEECSGACRDVQVDPSNCGACDAACAAGELCSAGMCQTSCGAGTTECSGVCRDLTTDRLHCGACDATCASGEICAGGMCVVSCPDGLVDCGGSCVDPDIDPAFCGASLDCAGANAGVDCTAAGELCVAGTCEMAACSEGETVCGAACVDTTNDGTNCGACGVTCAVGAFCVGAVCSEPDCSGGATRLSTNPLGNMVLCDDPADGTCEEDFATLCPAGWDLCTHLQHESRRAGWTYDLGSQRALGELYCRPIGGAGHFTVPDTGGSSSVVGDAVPFNCYYGSSRPSCTASYGCNEQDSQALCCAPTSTCGDGVVDSPEEDCDDMNSDETDACLNTCAWRVPTSHGYTGTNCE